jgi:hypothetical protein
VGDRTYHKFVLTLPEELVNSVGWEAGGEVTAKVRGREVVLSYEVAQGAAAGSKRTRSEYEDFRDRIRSELVSNAKGLTWQELRKSLRLDQKVPNNLWVRRMERDIGLLRIKVAGGTLWRLG